MIHSFVSTSIETTRKRKLPGRLDPDKVTSPGTKPDAHKFKEATHLRPVDSVQKDVPQAQSIEFEALPSIVRHMLTT